MDSNTESTTANETNGSTETSSPPAKNPHRRVKVYMLNNERAWDDKGTGHVSCAYVERFQGTALIVRSEDDDKTIILESKICPNTTYQKQQDTLICWSENEQELALSFQLIDSCSEIWEKICDVQGRDPGDNGQDDSLHDSRDEDHFDDTYSSSLLIELPSCDLTHLTEIVNVFNEHTMQSGGGVQWRMEKLATSIEADNYIPKLLELFTMCDDLEDIDALHQLFTIFKTIFMLNKNALFEIMFSSDNLMKVVGVMEHDPSKRTVTRHRDFLTNQAKFHHVLPIKNETLLDKIHQTYRVQYIQDVILPTPSVFDDNMLSALNSFIFFNKCEIVKLIQDDESLMRSLFQQLLDDETDDAARRNLIKFLKEFCNFSTSLQPSERDHFFQTLSEMRVLEAIETLWNLEDPEILSTTNDVFAFIADTNPSMVREFCLSEAKLGQDDLLMTKAIEQMQHDHDPELGGAILLSVTIRLLLDPENMLTTSSAAGAPSLRTEKTEFLNYFYNHCIQTLVAPLKSLTKDPESLKDDYRTAQLLNLTVELLSFCAEHHSYNFRIYMIRHEVLRKVLYLLHSKHAFLSLCVIRFVRRIIGLKDETHNRHIVHGNHMKAICDAFLANGDRYNLFNSAVIEMFEFIRTESIKSLAYHFVECHYNNGFKDIKYVKTFSLLKDQFDNRPSSANTDEDRSGGPLLDTLPQFSAQKRYKKDNLALEEEEEMWFEREDDDTDSSSGSGSLTLQSEEMDVKAEDSSVYKSNFPKSRVKSGKDEEEESDLPFNGGPKLNRGISINLKTLINSQPAAKSPPPSPPKGTTAPHSSPVNSKPMSALSATANKESSDVSASAGAGKVALVDYPDEDSDEDADNGENGVVTKRAKLDAT